MTKINFKSVNFHPRMHRFERFIYGYRIFLSKAFLYNGSPSVRVRSLI